MTSTNDYFTSLTNDIYSSIVPDDVITLASGATTDGSIEFPSEFFNYSVDSFDPTKSTVMMHMSPTSISSSKFFDMEDSSSSGSSSSISSHSSPSTPLSITNFNTSILTDSESDLAQLESALTQTLCDSNYIFSNDKPFESIDTSFSNKAPQKDLRIVDIDIDSLNGTISKDFDIESLLLDNTLPFDLPDKIQFKNNVFSDNNVLNVPHNSLEPIGSSPNEEDGVYDGDKPSAAFRKQSESRIALPELYKRMGLGDNHDEARVREQRILNILRREGFQLGEQTWIRDTTEKERKRIIDTILHETQPEYGYSRELIEVVVRRGSYYLMQGRLRRIRRGKKAMENKMRKAAAAAAASRA
jgi:hypothetical protein